MNDEDITTELDAEVFKAELVTLELRREAAGLNRTGAKPDDPPSASHGLVGLALSGGGIRSSTFSLGVIQALASEGAFRSVDYLSTVSGGGYTGSMLSTLLNDPVPRSEDGQPTDDAAAFPLAKPRGKEEPLALQRLRNGSNYLSPGGLMDTLRLPAVVIRGIALNCLLVLPYLMLLVLLTEFLHENIASVSSWLMGIPWIGPAFSPDHEVARHVVLLAGVYALLTGVGRPSWAARNGNELWLARLFGAAVLVAVAIPMLDAIDWAIQTPLRGKGSLAECMHGLSTLSATVVAGLGVGAYLIVRASQSLSRVASKALLYLAGALGPVLLFGVYLLMLVAQADSPYIEEAHVPTLEAAGLSLPASSEGASQIELTRDLADLFETKNIKYQPRPKALPAAYDQKNGWQLPQPSLLSAGASEADVGNELERARSLPDGQIEDAGFYRIARRDGPITVIGAKLRLGGVPSDQTLMSDLAFLLLALGLLLVNLFRLDVNLSSLHSFYRDRLTRLYLFRRDSHGGVIREDDQQLQDLNTAGSVAPYHLINATLNLQGSNQMSQRGRDADFFIFSKHYIGGPHTGYCKTGDLVARDGHVNLGTAMAISAAAAAPNMGSTTVRPLVFVLTMLNLRLGYWLPNPAWVRAGRRPLLPRPHTLFLLREARGALTARTARVNVSDGGHLENLAIYELLRRRCKLIIAVDGEADPQMTFGGLITLSRLAKIDLGIEISIDVETLKLRPDPRATARDGEPAELVSGGHFAVGTIDYGHAGGMGKLIYIKSSFCGEEELFIKKYRAENPSFPHETTADQFFDEVQFEAYRALGNHIGQQVTENSRTAALLGITRAHSGMAPAIEEERDTESKAS